MCWNNNSSTKTSLPSSYNQSLFVHVMFGKKSPDLDPYEIAKFNQYRAWKSENGEQIETDIIYNSGSGNQPCLHCGLPTWFIRFPPLLYKGFSP